MNVLILEDHPLTASVYAEILRNQDNKLTITNAKDCKQAYEAIRYADNSSEPFHFAIIDQSIPSYAEENLLSGADVALFIKKMFKGCKIIVITSHHEILIIYDLLRKVNPHGLASKNDINSENLFDIVDDVLNGKIYRSKLIKSCIDEVWTKDFIFDDYNRKILQYLAKGYTVKQLEEVVTLSTSAIQKRIIKLKKAFNADSEKDLIKKAIEQNFL